MKYAKASSLTILMILLVNTIVIGDSGFTVSVSQKVKLNTPDNKILYCNVIRDAADSLIWYYFPDRLNLFETKENNNIAPDYAMLRYQYKSPDNIDNNLEGGILQFGLAAKLKDDELGILKSFMESNYGNGIKLRPLQYNSVTVFVYAADAPSFSDHCPYIGTSSGTNGITSAMFDSRKIMFGLPYKNVEAKFIEPMITGKGLPVFMNVKYSSIIEGSKVSITIDWNKTRQYYFENSEFKSNACSFGYFGESSELDGAGLFTELVDHKCLMVKEGVVYSKSEIRKILKPLFEKINNHLIIQVRPPSFVLKTVADDPLKNVKLFSNSYSYKLIDNDGLVVTEEKLDFFNRDTIEERIVIPGLVTIAGYPKETKDRIITNATKDFFQKLHSLLPLTPAKEDASDLGISQAEISLSIKSKTNESQVQKFIWNPSKENSWLDMNNNKCNSFAFSIPEVVKAGDYYGKLVFKENLKISFNSNYSVEFKKEYPAYSKDGGVSFYSESRFNILEINASSLFNDMNKAKGITEVDIELKYDSITTVHKSYKPMNPDGSVKTHKSVKFVIPPVKSINNIQCKIIFTDKNGKKGKWQFNNQNLKNIVEFKNGIINLKPEQIIM